MGGGDVDRNSQNRESDVSMKFRLIVIAAVVAWGAAGAALANEAWRMALTDTNWQRLTGNGCLLVSASAGLGCYDGGTAEERWQRSEFAGIAGAGVTDLRSVPYLLIDPAAGKRLRRKDPIPAKEIINAETGETLFKLEGRPGTLNGLVPVADAGLVLAIETVKAKKRDDSGIYLTAFDLATGESRWRIKYGDSRAKLNGSLIAYPQPVASGGVIYLSYFGVHAIDAASGSVLWSIKANPLSGSLRQTTSPPVIVDGVAYVPVGREIHARDAKTGKVVWNTKLKRSASVPEIQVSDNYVVARLGGIFSDGRKVNDSSTLGVVAFDRAGGALRWQYNDAKGGITNLMVDEAKDLVAFADATTIIGVKLSLGAPRFEVPINYFRRYGIFKPKSGGFGISGGYAKSGPGGSSGKSGGLGGGGCSMEVSDLSFDVEFQRKDIMIRGQHSIIAFDPEARSIQWSMLFGDTKRPFSEVLRTGRLPGYSQKGLSYFLTIQNVGKGRRNREMFMLLGIDPVTDRVVSRVDLDGKNPVFMVDHARDRMFRVYYEKKSRKKPATTTIVGYAL